MKMSIEEIGINENDIKEVNEKIKKRVDKMNQEQEQGLIDERKQYDEEYERMNSDNE